MGELPDMSDYEFMDRLPPHSMEAEQGVLGCIMLSPACITDCVTKLRGGSEAFYDLRNRTIFEALSAMADDHKPIDMITVQQCLKEKKLLSTAGGLPYIGELSNATPTAANLDYYLDLMIDAYTRRKLIQVCTQAVGEAYQTEKETTELVDCVESQVMAIASTRLVLDDQPVKELVHESITELESIHQSQGALRGLSTGFIDLDKISNGLEPEDFMIIAGRPSIGKTSLAMNIVEHLVVDMKQAVGVFSLEMSARQLVMRMLCSRARVNLRNVRDGFLAERDFPKLATAAAKIANSGLHICDKSALSIMEIRARARRMVEKYDVKLFVVDYLQLAQSHIKRGGNRQQEISDISGGLKALAKETKRPVISNAQMSRDIEKEKHRRIPRLSDLRESGALEQDADKILMLYKPQTDEDEPENGDALSVSALMAKNRNGPTGNINLTFLKGFTRFESASRVSADDIPDQTSLPLKNPPLVKFPYNNES